MRISLAGCFQMLMLAASLCTHAQTSTPDTAFLQEARASAIAAYKEGIGPALPVFQGREWVAITQKAKGHPFYAQPGPSAGAIRFGGIEYAPLSLQYDVFANELLLLPANDGLRLVVPRQKVSAFTIGQDYFIRPDAIQASLGLSDTGYYRLLYQGPSSVLVRHWKEVKYQPGEEIHEAYMEYSTYYMMDGKIFRVISGEQDLLSLKGKKNRELKKLLSEKKIKFRKKPELALITAGAFYDRLP